MNQNKNNNNINGSNKKSLIKDYIKRLGFVNNDDNDNNIDIFFFLIFL